MQSSEIRTKFLEFFRERGHKIVKSDSLVPRKDPTLLFTGAGMNQFKEMFLATATLKFTRAASSQKCLRTLDIGKVGKTASHHTFFEMLGNFSFGDYFKKETIVWAWEFLTQELDLPEEKLLVSIYEDDDEAAEIWMEGIGVPTEKISRLGSGENFWPANAQEDGPNGPCGPCSEIFYDKGPEIGCGRDECGVACDCDRYVEVWNLVFTQYNRRDGGVLEPLQKYNIDTGMGLERITSVIQGTESNFETDLFMPLIERTADTLGVKYDKHAEEGARLRRIADHARAAAFCVGDGVLPSNEGRGYVLRRIIRRALNDGRVLGASGNFFYKLVPQISEMMGDVYPEVREMRESIVQILVSEEERFRSIIHQGTLLLEDEAKRMLAEGRDTLAGEDVFRLYDTYGLPLDMAEDILAGKNLEIDRAGFEREMQHQRDRARAAGISGIVFAHEKLQGVVDEVGTTEFIGYEKVRSRSTVRAILVGEESVKETGKGTEVTLLLDKTPFYSEAGGQTGDAGKIKGKSFEVEVVDTKRYGDTVLHEGKVVRGKARVGETVTCTVSNERRGAVARSHTATHLLHHVLRETLGRHVKQAGSLVEPDRLRFDLTHPSAITEEQKAVIEDGVNNLVMSDDPVRTREMSMEEALKKGAIALFGEKYGDQVRVVSAGKYSSELCGGTHCRRTGEIGLFRITGEESVAAGVRRIEALTGRRAMAETVVDRSLIAEAGERLGVQKENVLDKIASLAADVKNLRQNVIRLKEYDLKVKADEVFRDRREVNGVTVVSSVLSETDMEGLRKMTDFVRDMAKEPVVTLAGSEMDGKGFFVCTVSDDLVTKGIKARDIVDKAASIIEGGGGGRPNMAQAGGKRGDRIKEAMDAAADVLAVKLKNL